MRTVQLALFVAWMVLIVSLFWDPVTPWLTQPGNLASPFRIRTAGIMVQTAPVLNKPYAMGARIFWAMVVPILPIFLMVFGHEAWRRICPLSFASQIPRRLGFNRKRPELQRRTGRVEHAIVLIKRQSWLQRNAWYLQGGLLFLGLDARLLFINSDRTTMGLFLLGVIASSIVVGYLWGGKSWCNYFCPVNVVQKIYTEPRGILESSPHLSREPISASMCRTSSPQGEKSACVGCISNCTDFDIENSYWNSISEPKRRHVYYMFWGLIVGFYGYYYLYSGTWDYYFSGIWTHEENSLGKLFKPGLYILGTAIALPKIIAAPLVLALACFSSLGISLGLEKLYRRFRRKSKAFSEADLVNHCLCFSSYVSINLFYLFGGRPNLLLAPPEVIRFVDIMIMSLTTWWFVQATQRTPSKFRRESMASSLLEQLKRLKVDVSKFLEGRTLDELKPDEVYVLTKVLPAFSHDQKVQAYRQILDDAIATGKTKSTMSLALLHEMRTQMNISDEEHAQLLETLRDAPGQVQMAQNTTSREKLECIRNYTEILGGSIVKLIEAGKTLQDSLDDAIVTSTGSILRASFQISDTEHAAVVADILSSTGMLMARANQRLAGLNAMLSARFCIHSVGMTDEGLRAIGNLLIASIDEKIEQLDDKLLSILAATGDSIYARWTAHSMAILLGQGLRDRLASPARADSHVSWADLLDEHLLRILQGVEVASDLQHPAPEGVKEYTYRGVISEGIDLLRNLHRLAEENDPVLLALVIAFLSAFDADAARDLAHNSRQQGGSGNHWLLVEVVDKLLDGPPVQDPSIVENLGATSSPISADYVVQTVDSITKMAWLLRSDTFAKVPSATLAQLAAASEVRRYVGGANVCRAGASAQEVFVPCQGGFAAQIIDGARAGDARELGETELIGETRVGGVHAETVVATSPTAQVLSLKLDESLVLLIASAATQLHEPTDELLAAGGMTPTPAISA